MTGKVGSVTVTFCAMAAVNKNKYTASVAAYNIVVNGKKIQNSKEQYPLLQFRDVTYFPLTWRTVSVSYQSQPDADNHFHPFAHKSNTSHPARLTAMMNNIPLPIKKEMSRKKNSA